MKPAISEVLVFGNSNGFGFEIGTKFLSLAECIEQARTMTKPHLEAWPSQLMRLGVKVQNFSLPASGFFSNVARAIALFPSHPNALSLIDISLFDHLADQKMDFRSRNALIIQNSSVERDVYELSVRDQIFIFNEFRKLLHQLKMKFKFITPTNPFLDFSKMKSDAERTGYAAFLRSTAFQPMVTLDADMQSDFLLEKPYFQYVSEDKVSEFSHLTEVESLKSIAQLIFDRIKDSYEIG